VEFTRAADRPRYDRDAQLADLQDSRLRHRLAASAGQTPGLTPLSPLAPLSPGLDPPTPALTPFDAAAATPDASVNRQHIKPGALTLLLVRAK